MSIAIHFVVAVVHTLIGIYFSTRVKKFLGRRARVAKMCHMKLKLICKSTSIC